MLSYPGMAGCGIAAVELGHELAARGHQAHFITYDAPFRLDLAMENIFFHPVDVFRFDLFRSPDSVIPLVTKTVAIADIYRIDVIHAHYAVPYAFVACMARKMSSGQPRVVTTVHGTDVTWLGKSTAYERILRYSLEESDVVTAVSRHLMEEVQPMLSPAKKVELVCNFSPARMPSRRRADVRKELGVSETDFLLLHMSNLRKLKRGDDILEALARCRSSAKLLILAGGSACDSVQKIRRMGIADRVRVLQRVADVENYVNAADAGIYASEIEECSLAVLETMSLGKPVICTGTGGTPEVVDESGILCGVGDVEELARSIDRLAGDRGLRQNLGHAARIRVETRFSREGIVGQYLNLYMRKRVDQTTGSGNPPSPGTA